MMYKIVWEIELDADSPLEAAQEALSSVSEGTAKCFIVQDEETHKLYSIDLNEPDEDRELPLDKYEPLIK